MTNPLRPRMVRLPTKGISADLKDGRGEAVNIGTGGAFLRVDFKPEVGSHQHLVLAKGEHRLAVDAVVLRVSPDSSAAEPDRFWLVAVQFKDDPGEVRRLISKLLEPAPFSRTARHPGAEPLVRRS